MLNLAKMRNPQEVCFYFGDVETRQGDRCLICTGFTKVLAERSQGCLIEPQPGDRVLVAFTDCEAYILQVLKPDGTDRPTSLVIDGDAEMRVSGAMNFKAKALSVGGADSVEVRTSRFLISFFDGLARFGRCSLAGGTLSRSLQNLKTTAQSIETEAERVFDRFQRLYRRVAEFEDSRIGRVMSWVKDAFILKSGNTAIQSEESVKIEADRIHLG